MKIKHSLVLIGFMSMFYLATTAFTTLSHSNDDTATFEGYWVYKSYKDKLKVFVKSDDFKANKPGYKFNKDGSSTVRMDPNWCLRKPGPYANTEGSWKVLEDDILYLTYKCWDKSSFQKYTIVEHTKKKLVLKYFRRVHKRCKSKNRLP